MCVKIDLFITERECAIPYVYIAIKVSAVRRASVHDAMDSVGHFQIGIFVAGRERMCRVIAVLYLHCRRVRGSYRGGNNQNRRNAEQCTENALPLSSIHRRHGVQKIKNL
jgi:hypothetical protein